MKWFWVVLLALFVFVLFDAKTGFPREWGPSEGRLLNLSGDTGICLWDNPMGELCAKWVDHGHWCRGDAMFVNEYVFKVPNRTNWQCDTIRCEARDLRSYLVFEAAKIKNGSEKYGEMTLDHFKNLMWDWSIQMCE